MDGRGSQVRASLAAVRSVFANPNLRRIELAFAGSAIGHYAFSVSTMIYAYHEGGVTAVGVVTAVRQAAAAGARTRSPPHSPTGFAASS